MTAAENVHPDMVIRARVKLLGVDRLPDRERVDAYRLLSRVDPRHLPRLAHYLLVQVKETIPPEPLRSALIAEATAIAHTLPATDPDRARLLDTVRRAEAEWSRRVS